MQLCRVFHLNHTYSPPAVKIGVKPHLVLIRKPLLLKPTAKNDAKGLRGSPNIKNREPAEQDFRRNDPIRSFAAYANADVAGGGPGGCGVCVCVTGERRIARTGDFRSNRGPGRRHASLEFRTWRRRRVPESNHAYEPAAEADRLACIRGTCTPVAAHRNYVTNIIAIDQPAAFDVDAFMKCRHADNHARPAPKAKSDLQY